MLYGATHTWWGRRRPRQQPHEGLDVSLYSDRLGRLNRLDEKIRIPAAATGKVLNIIDDFLGKSIIIADLSGNPDGSALLFIYGHTDPVSGIGIGDTVDEGQMIATIAAIRRNESVPPHLHLSIGRLSGRIAFQELTWEIMGYPHALTLYDPMQVMIWNYRMENQEESGQP
jgi:hypothetical protein